MARHEYRLEALGWTRWLGATDTLVKYQFLGRKYVRVQELILPAVEAMEMALRANGYEDPCDFTGSYLYRTIGNKGEMWSSHAYGLALDVDYGYIEADRLVDKNPYLGFRPTREQYGVLFQFTWEDVQAVKAIKNIYGEPMWLWLGDTSLGDTMHWQINVAPDRCEVDWTTVLGFVPEPEEGDEEMTLYQDLLDRWDVDDLEHFQALGWWSGSPTAAADYYKNVEVPPADADVKTLVTSVLANGAVFASYDSEEPDEALTVRVGKLEEEVVAVEVDQADLRQILRSV